MTDERIEVRAVVFPEGDHWVAQCLEYDVATQARSYKRLQDSFRHLIASHIELALQAGEVPFKGVGRAPDRFWKMFEDSDNVGRVRFPEVAADEGTARTDQFVAPRFSEMAFA